MTKEMQVIYDFLKEKYNVLYTKKNGEEIVFYWDKEINEGYIFLIWLSDNLLNFGVLTDDCESTESGTTIAVTDSCFSGMKLAEFSLDTVSKCMGIVVDSVKECEVECDPITSYSNIDKTIEAFLE